MCTNLPSCYILSVIYFFFRNSCCYFEISKDETETFINGKYKKELTKANQNFYADYVKGSIFGCILTLIECWALTFENGVSWFVVYELFGSVKKILLHSSTMLA